MSFLYRPTPVVNLGSGPFASTRVISGWPGASMRGIPAGAGVLGAGGPTGAVSRMRRVDTRMQPWLKSSGTMGSFIPNGLGQDDGSGIDWSTAGDITPNLPAPNTPDLVLPDLGSPSFSPNLPALIPPSSGPLPPPSFFTNPSPILPSTGPGPASLPPGAQIFLPTAGSGPTGTGIPGTQPANPPPPPAANAIATAASTVANAVKNLFSPTPAVPPGYKQLPGYGGGVAPAGSAAAPGGGLLSSTFLTQAAVVLIGAALLVSFLPGKKR